MYIYLARAPYRGEWGERLYKIGITKSPASRKNTLSNSGVCGHFELMHSQKVAEARDCELSVFKTLDFYRYRSDKEFFVFESDEIALRAACEAIDYYKIGKPVSSVVMMPNELLEQLEDRWMDEEYAV